MGGLCCKRAKCDSGCSQTVVACGLTFCVGKVRHGAPLLFSSPVWANPTWSPTHVRDTILHLRPLIFFCSQTSTADDVSSTLFPQQNNDCVREGRTAVRVFGLRLVAARHGGAVTAEQRRCQRRLRSKRRYEQLWVRMTLASARATTAIAPRLCLMQCRWVRLKLSTSHRTVGDPMPQVLEHVVELLPISSE